MGNDLNIADTDIQDEIIPELERILKSRKFKRSKRLSSFLSYIVMAHINGKADEISEITIAQDVFGKDVGYHPALDSIVRVAANRLRAALKTYYSGPGQTNPIRIYIPVGYYEPEFRAYTPESNPERTIAAELRQSPIKEWRGRLPKILMGVVPLVIMCFFIWSVNKGDGRNQSATTAHQVSKYPLIAITPFKNETGFARYDFLEQALQNRLVQDLSRFRVVRPVAEDNRIEEILTNSDVPYEYAISAIVLAVEPEVDILLKVVDPTTGRAILERRAKQSVETSDYYDTLSKIVIELSGQAKGAISEERFALIEKQIEFGNLQLSDIDAFECIQIANETILARGSDLYRKGYTCLEAILLKQPDDPNIIAKLGTLKYIGAVSYEPIFEARSVDPDVSAADGKLMIERALDIHPENADLHRWYSELQKLEGNRELSLKHAELAYRANPGEPANLAGLSRRLGGDGQWERALALSAEAIQRNPFPKSHYYYTAFTHALVKGDAEAMQSIANRIVELEEYGAEMFLLLAAVANGNEQSVMKLRPQVIHYATRTGDPDRIVEFIALHGNEEIVTKVRDLFEAGGVF